MANKHSQGPEVGIDHGNQGEESFLLQMLRQLRPSTSDLPIEVLGEMIMDAGEQEARDALELIRAGISTAPGHKALGFLTILSGLARGPEEGVRAEAMTLFDTNVLALYRRVGVELRVRIRGLVLELKGMLDTEKGDRIQNVAKEFDEIDRIEGVGGKESCEKENE